MKKERLLAVVSLTLVLIVVSMIAGKIKYMQKSGEDFLNEKTDL